VGWVKERDRFGSESIYGAIVRRGEFGERVWHPHPDPPPSRGRGISRFPRRGGGEYRGSPVEGEGNIAVPPSRGRGILGFPHHLTEGEGISLFRVK